MSILLIRVSARRLCLVRVVLCRKRENMTIGRKTVDGLTQTEFYLLRMHTYTEM